MNKDVNKEAEEWIKSQYCSIYNFLVNREYELSLNRTKKLKGLYKRDDQGDYWWELRSCNYMDDFYKQKIIYPETTQGAYFYLDDNQYFIDKTCFMITGSNLKFLLANLSSSLFEFAYRYIYSSIELGKKAYQYNKHALIMLPILNPLNISRNEKQYIEDLVEKALKSEDAEKKQYIKLLDDAIYQLYDISKEEIEFINNYK